MNLNLKDRLYTTLKTLEKYFKLQEKKILCCLAKILILFMGQKD